MKIGLLKRIVFRNLQYRIFAVLIVAVWIFGGRFWQPPEQKINGRFTVYLQPESEKITQNRDLSIYDFGGRIEDCFNNFHTLPKLCESSKTQARNFILDHWKNKKHAYIILEHNAVDNFSEHYVFIEPDNEGKWQIVWSKEFSDFERGFGKSISSTFAKDVKRKKVDEDDYPFKRGYYALFFLDGEGKEIYIY